MKAPSCSETLALPDFASLTRLFYSHLQPNHIGYIIQKRQSRIPVDNQSPIEWSPVNDILY